MQLEKTQHGSEAHELLDHLANADSHNDKQHQEDSEALREVVSFKWLFCIWEEGS